MIVTTSFAKNKSTHHNENTREHWRRANRTKVLTSTTNLLNRSFVNINSPWMARNQAIVPPISPPYKELGDISTRNTSTFILIQPWESHHEDPQFYIMTMPTHRLRSFHVDDTTPKSHQNEMNLWLKNELPLVVTPFSMVHFYPITKDA